MSDLYSSDNQKNSDNLIEESHDTSPSDPSEDNKMEFSDHLAELRQRLIKISIAVFIGFGGCYYFAKELFYYFTLPLLKVLPEGNTLIFTSLPEGFFTYLKISFFAGFILVSPYIFYQLWKFISPGLYPKERKYVLPFVAASTIFFVMGVSFAYFIVFPFGFEFFLSFQNDYIKALPTLQQYLKFALQLLFAFGLIFEMPVIFYFLAKIKLINSNILTKNRRYTVVIIFIVAAILTPPDVFTQFLMAIPLLLLYELSILIVKRVEKSQKVAEEAKDKDEAV